MRNVITIPTGNGNSLILASDNSGAIGMKTHDHVQASYEMVAYYSFRVAAMECMSAGGVITAVILQNFCGDESWEQLVKGIQKGVVELGLNDISITGSTESNFSLLQSAIGLIVMGGTTTNIGPNDYTDGKKLAVVGRPLVGNEVMEQEDQVVSLQTFHQICQLEDVVTWPVGSKGILSELKKMYHNMDISKETIETDLDIGKSSGPATCFIVAYPEYHEGLIKQWAGSHFYSIKIQK